MRDKDILNLLERIAKSASTGKNYAKSEYDFDRYSEIVELTKQLYSKIDGFDQVQIDTLAEKAYLTPKVGVNAIVTNEKDEFLLEQRMDDKCWGIPGGWAEVGLNAEENIKKEIREETGFEVVIEKLVGVISRKPSKRYLLTSYHLLFKCNVVGGELKKSYESEEVAWRKLEDITEWHADHQDWIEFYFNKEKS